MCGIVGLLDKQGRAQRFRSALERATESLSHRGPDDFGTFYDGACGLGFRRLSILDLSAAGHQPMTSADGRWTVCFNGEIYNWLELRAGLRQLGVSFHSNCDTEVLVEALALWGVRAFDLFNGMWGVLAWHAPTRTLYACRDPWGIKPLVLYEDDETVALSSEIRGLRALGLDLGTVDPVAARMYVELGELDIGSRTLFQRVTRLKAGVIYSWGPDQRRIERPYDDGTSRALTVSFRDGPRGEDDFVEAFRTAMLESVRLRLRSDVALGTCLSGGLDSTTIACAAADLMRADGSSNQRYAFTALLPEFDESKYIRPVIDRCGAEWHVTVVSDARITESIEPFFAAHDEPVHSLSALAGYVVMAMAAQAGVKVLLNGQGSDEALAGYPSSVLPFLRSLLHDEGGAYSLTQATAEAGSTVGGLGLLSRARAGEVALKLAGTFQQRKDGGAPAARGSLSALISAVGPLAVALPQTVTPSGSLVASQQHQMSVSPLPLYLRIEDTNSSAFSLEARLPFLDPAVVALARAAPTRMMRRDGLNKYLLRRILPGLVPDIVWQRRDKWGFPVPHARWLRGPLKDRLIDSLSSERIRRRGWFDATAVENLRDHFLAGGPLDARLTRLFLLENWAARQLDTPVPRAVGA